MAAEEEIIVLMDNGSLRAEATLQLRILAKALGEKLQKPVRPVSLLHSAKLNPAELDGEAAQTLVPFLRAQRELGHDVFTIVPLFFGPSGALVDYLPRRLSELRQEGWEELKVAIAPTLVRHDDSRVAEIMAGLVHDKMDELGWSHANVAMCDHGTPARAVNDVREIVAMQLQKCLVDKQCRVTACSMERREGAEYDFNEPLLERLLGTQGYEKKVIVSMLFAGPGRHAGVGGDVAEICQESKRKYPQLETEMTGLVGSSVRQTVDVLADRYDEVKLKG
ncbi:MAG: cobalamin biosynthesis protein CbiX [Rubritalea sp.]|uniref:sirohydrochlorin chelatase n=1 Tax=Rubritalea sp. TaxID=2109375 RepID=UPI003241DD5C